MIVMIRLPDSQATDRRIERHSLCHRGGRRSQRNRRSRGTHHEELCHLGPPLLCSRQRTRPPRRSSMKLDRFLAELTCGDRSGTSELLETFLATARSPSTPPEENAMKSITRTVLALALLGVPSLALAQTPAPA